MDLNTLSPYVRLATLSELVAPCRIAERVLMDHELILVEDGSAVIRIDGVPYVCTRGTAILLRPGIPHDFAVNEGVFSQPHIHFDLTYDMFSPHRTISFKAYGEMSEAERAMIAKDTLPNSLPAVFHPTDPAFSEAFFEIIHRFSDPKARHPLAVRGAMLTLLSLLIEPKETPTDTDEIRRICSYLDVNYAAPLSLDALSAQFHLNKFTLLRRFKEQVGVCPLTYRNRRRLTVARHLLLSTALSVRRIGELLGYEDAYSFSRAFKADCGTPPLAYRKRAARNSAQHATTPENAE